MYRNRTDTGIMTAGLLFAAMFTVIMGRYYVLSCGSEYTAAAQQRGRIKLTVECGEGNIFDRNMKPLVNRKMCYTAVACPSLIDMDEAIQYAVDKEYFSEKFSEGMPFEFECTAETPDSTGITVFNLPQRYEEVQTAQHVIGYTSQGRGVTGIEYAYDSILRNEYAENSVQYCTDGFGNVLAGESAVISRNNMYTSGVVTTIDYDIQQICENAGEEIEMGAICAADVETGEIVAMASFPTYSVYDLEAALNDERSPMINRNLYSYSVGSIFKLVTACGGMNEGMDGYRSECMGYTDINGKNFNCHKLEGHGVQDLKSAMVNSCNTYFINLCRNLDTDLLRETAFALGFGREIHLCSGMTASGGILPTVKQLDIPAELANFSFGQGKLTASPLQILRFTCAIANDGKMPELTILKGFTEDGKTVSGGKYARYSYVIDEDKAKSLQSLMISAVYENEASNAIPLYTTAGAKTSTAQTGRVNEEGEEEYNAWITGFFPADNPRYALTVLIEDGGYGNDSAAPVFRKIADEITKLEEKH